MRVLLDHNLTDFTSKTVENDAFSSSAKEIPSGHFVTIIVIRIRHLCLEQNTIV